MASRSRGWCFTLNNYSDKDEISIKTIECKYLIVGHEVGEGGTKHLQGYIEFENPQRLGGLKKLLEKAHWEARRGTPAEAAQYCKKEGNWHEKGELPKQGRRSDLEEAAALVQTGAPWAEIAQAHPATYVRYHRGLEAMKGTQYSDRKEPPEVIWLWGVTGSGKTREAVDCETFYIKDGTKWWDGYEQQVRIVIDDFDGVWPFRDLLRLLDRYPYQGQTKGGYVKINSPKIYITCEYPPDHWWSNNELAQMTRRITKIKLCGT